MVVHDFAYADLAFDGYRPPSFLAVPGREGGRRRVLLADEVVQHGGLAARLRLRQPADDPRARPDQVLPRLRRLPAHPDRRHHRARGRRRPAWRRSSRSTAGAATSWSTGSTRSAGPSRSRGARCSSGRRSPRRSAGMGSLEFAKLLIPRRRWPSRRASASASTARATSASRWSRTSSGSGRPCAGSGPSLG